MPGGAKTLKLYTGHSFLFEGQHTIFSYKDHNVVLIWIKLSFILRDASLFKLLRALTKTTYSEDNSLWGGVFCLFVCFDLEHSPQKHWKLQKLKTSNLPEIHKIIIIPVRKGTNLLRESYHPQAYVSKEMCRCANRLKCFFSHFIG